MGSLLRERTVEPDRSNSYHLTAFWRRSLVKTNALPLLQVQVL